MLFLSRIHPKKGLELLLDAMAVRSGKLSEARLVVAGSGDPAYVAGLRRRAEGPSLAGRVTFTGWLSGQEKIEALADCDLFVLPSFQENFAIAVLEAMACGVPVVVGTGVNLKDAICDAGAGVAIGPGRDELRETLSQLLEDTAARKEMGTAARNCALGSYTWPAVTSLLVEAYESVLAESVSANEVMA